MRFSSPSQTLGRDEAQTNGQEEVTFDPPPSCLGGEDTGRTCITDSETIQDPARFGEREGGEESMLLTSGGSWASYVGGGRFHYSHRQVGDERMVARVASSR